MLPINGILDLYKDEGMTSHDAVAIVRRIYKTKKVGHTGTLDPMARGVLPILVGNAVKASEYVMEGDKRYIARMRFGISTDTLDITGAVLSESCVRPSYEELSERLESFTGPSMQIPPMYSAIKKDGKKLYELAREGIEIELEPRPIEIFSLKLLSFDGEEAELDITCSKGTYIRSLVRDIALSCGTVGTMTALERVSSHGFLKENAVTVERLKEAAEEELISFIMPVETVFSESQRVHLSPFYTRLAKNGAEIYVKKARLNVSPSDKKILMYGDDGVFFALGELREFEEGMAVKPVKLFL